MINGRLSEPNLSCFAKPFAVRNTRLTQSIITASNQGALVALMTETDSTPVNLTDMKDVIFQGPHSNSLNWRRFDEKFKDIFDYWNGMDCQMANGFHLLNEHSSEIAYVNFWTCGKSIDLSTHNHSNDPSEMAPAFAEIHWVFNNGTGKGGMYHQESREAGKRNVLAMQRGDEHGPFFAVDPVSGYPKRRDNKALVYPWHGWQGGSSDVGGQVYDFVAAFEINPEFAGSS